MQTSTNTGTITNGGTSTNSNINTTAREQINLQRKQQQENINNKTLNTLKKGKVVVKKYYKDKTS